MGYAYQAEKLKIPLVHDLDSFLETVCDAVDKKSELSEIDESQKLSEYFDHLYSYCQAISYGSALPQDSLDTKYSKWVPALASFVGTKIATPYISSNPTFATYGPTAAAAMAFGIKYKWENYNVDKVNNNAKEQCTNILKRLSGPVMTEEDVLYAFGRSLQPSRRSSHEYQINRQDKDSTFYQQAEKIAQEYHIGTGNSARDIFTNVVRVYLKIEEIIDKNVASQKGIDYGNDVDIYFADIANAHLKYKKDKDSDLRIPSYMTEHIDPIFRYSRDAGRMV